MMFCISRDVQASLINREEEEGVSHQETYTNFDPASPTDLKGSGGLSPPPNHAQNKMNLDNLVDRIKSNVYTPTLLSKKLGTGKMQNMSHRLTRFMQDLEESAVRLIRKYNGDVLLIDTIFESGNILRADIITRSEYRLYMQVDTNTRGHQQWFYFRVRNTRKDRKYLFKLMNFTKPGITGGSGYRKNELFQRVMYKSKGSKHTEWMSIGPEKLEFVKTKVQRRKKDALAAGADSDQEDWVEEAYGNDPNMQDEDGGLQRLTSNPTSGSPLKKKRKFYYYALEFEVEFEHDEDVVYFAFSQPYSYSQIVSDLLEKEDELKPA